MPIVTATGALRAWYSVGIVLVTAAAMVVLGVLYDGHQQREADRRWCAMLAIQAAEQPAPSTPRGVAAQAEAQRLARAFGCPR